MSVSCCAAGGLCLWNDLLVPIGQDAVRVVSLVLMLWQRENFFVCRKSKSGLSVNRQFVLMGCCNACDVLMVPLSVPALRR